MVKELLTLDRIQQIQRIDSWEDAVTLAAQPLLRDGSITTEYVARILQNILQYGPYMVLAELFALPHAPGDGCVNLPCLSLLQLAEPVDFVGKPVNILMILGAPDNRSHIETLSGLMPLFYCPDCTQVLGWGSPEAILEFIDKL